MATQPDRRKKSSASDPVSGSFNAFLRFDRHTEHAYEKAHREDRIAHVRRIVYLGLFLYNIYNLTSFLVLPDIFWLSFVLRILVITPVSLLALELLVDRLPAEWREWALTIGMLNAFSMPVAMFWLSDAPLAVFALGEFLLTLVYTNMLVVLRFRHAAFFTGGALIVLLTVILTKEGLSPSLQIALTLQMLTGCGMTLHANYLAERRRCIDYIRTRGADRRANSAERAERQMQQISMTDALTGLPNRRYLDQTLDAWMGEASNIAVIMVDIDHFKLFNDTLGHPAGDDCLRAVAQVFKATARKEDIFCARFGGEEFTVVIRNSPRLEVARIARQLARAIEGLGIAHPGRNDGLAVVTASLGVAYSAAPIPAGKGTLLGQADEALYRAKRLGRNQVASAEDISTRGTA